VFYSSGLLLVFLFAFHEHFWMQKARISSWKSGHSIFNCNKYKNDVNNQQDAKTFSFINLFNSALHVSGDKLAHPQEHFLTLYTAFSAMHRHCCRMVHCTKSCINSQKMLLRMGKLPPETCWADLKSLINEKFVAFFWLFISFY